MLRMRALLILALIAFYAASIEAATKNHQLVRVHRVTRKEYDELKRLSQGKNEVSEARIISSGIASLKGLVTGLTAGISTNFIPSFLNYFNPPKVEPGKEGYPLCVISASDVDVNEERKADGRSISWTATAPAPSDNGNSGHDHDHNSDDDHGHDDDHDHGHDDDHDQGNDHGHDPGHGSDPASGNSDETPIVNCIIIIKDKNHADSTNHPDHPYYPHYPHYPDYPNYPDYPHHPNYPYHHDPYPYHHYDPNFGYPPPYGYQYSLPPPPTGYYYGPPIDTPYNPYHPDEKDFNPELARTVNYYDYQPYLGYYKALAAVQSNEKPKRKSNKRSRANQSLTSSEYEPINYPQHDYASNYPKISRNYGLTHPAPVYVKNPQQEQN